MGSAPMRYTQTSGYDIIVKTGIFRSSRVIYRIDTTYKTWLHRYAELGEPECLRIILEAHIKNGPQNLPGCPSYVDCRDGQGRTALHYAAMSGVPGCIQLLLKDNADPGAADYDGNRPCDFIGLGRDTGPHGFQVDIETCQRLLSPHEQT